MEIMQRLENPTRAPLFRNRALRKIVAETDKLFKGQFTAIAQAYSDHLNLLALVEAVKNGEREAEQNLERELMLLENSADWRQLPPRIRAVLEGERGAPLFVGIDAIDQVLLRAVVALLDQSVPTLVHVPARH
jgi:hypothetical protein